LCFSSKGQRYFGIITIILVLNYINISYSHIQIEPNTFNYENDILIINLLLPTFNC